MQRLYPIPSIQKQKGQTCKLFALSNAINWLHQTYTEQCAPITVRKSRSRVNTTTSLRTLAKRHLNSQVGEVYGDLRFLQLATKAGFDNFQSILCPTTEQFCQLIVAAIQHGLMPVVMFDVNVFTGMPIKDNGDHEHAVVVTGYHYHKTKGLMFTVGQWNAEYTFSAQALAESNFQLAEQTRAESFIKVNERWINQVDFLASHAEPALFEQRHANKHSADGGTFRQKVILAAPNGIDYTVNLAAQSSKPQKLEIIEKKINHPLSSWVKLAIVSAIIATVLAIPAALLAANILALSLAAAILVMTTLFTLSAFFVALMMASIVKDRQAYKIYTVLSADHQAQDLKRLITIDMKNIQRKSPPSENQPLNIHEDLQPTNALSGHSKQAVAMPLSQPF